MNMLQREKGDDNWVDGPIRGGTIITPIVAHMN